MKKVKVSIISYLNTAPFEYGLKHSDIIDYIDLKYDTPANCATRLMNKDADIGIVPAAIIPLISGKKIISNYCIGASGAVRSVAICSNYPLLAVKNLYLDCESRTSVLLAQLLMENYWKVDATPINLNSLCEIDPQKENSAYVLIGDKVFEYEKKFEYHFDLAEAWQNHTGLPFVFAAWTSTTTLSKDFISDFNSALSYGLENIPKAIDEHQYVIDRKEAIKYLTQNIDYNLNYAKCKALIEFWNMAKKSKYRS